MALGFAVALHASPSAESGLWLHGLLALVAALAAHVSVNALNEYVDFKTELDQQTQRTPFSGGSGTLPAHPALAGLTLAAAVLALGVTCVIGLYFVGRWPHALTQLAPLGLLGVALVAGYSPWITRNPWLCLIAPGLGFGPLMVAGTQFALAGRYTEGAWWASAVAFFLVNNLLLLNQFPDVEPDRAVGRKTLPIVLGRRRCVAVLAAQWLLAYGALGCAVLLGALPVAALAGCLTAPLAMVAWHGARHHADDLPGLLPAMGMNVAVTLATPLLTALGTVLASR